MKLFLLMQPYLTIDMYIIGVMQSEGGDDIM